MSCSKPLPPFVCDSLYYLNRNQLECFSIVCRPLKNFIDRYLHSKPYRVFDCLYIRGGWYALIHNGVQWHPNRDDCSAQQFSASQESGIEPCHWDECDYYSFAEMHSYLGPAIRLKATIIFEARDHIYNSEHIEQMESIAYLWRDQILVISPSEPYNNWFGIGNQIDVNNFQPILNSPTILQCHSLRMHSANFSFKDYSVLYSLKRIEVLLTDKNHLWQQYWQQFLEQPGVKPVVVFDSDDISDNRHSIIDLLSKESGIEPCHWDECDYYSFAEMHSYLGPAIRLKATIIFEARDHIYNSEHIEQMESIAYLWRDQILVISPSEPYNNWFGIGNQIDVNNFQPILNSPTILQCHSLRMHSANFSFKDYSVLYSLKRIEVLLTDKNHLWQQYWQQFLEQPGVKPVVVFDSDDISDNRHSIIDLLSKAFSSAVVPNAFKIVFVQANKPLTEFRETNKTSGEILELKKGLPAEFGKKYLEMFKNCNNYTLERSSI